MIRANLILGIANAMLGIYLCASGEGLVLVVALGCGVGAAFNFAIWRTHR